MSIRQQDAKAIALISTDAAGEQAAADAIARQLPGGEDGFTILFCCSRYDLGRLGCALSAAGHDRVVAAATSRAIGPAGLLVDGITGFHLPAGRFKVADALIENVVEFGLPDATRFWRSATTTSCPGDAVSW
jgi:hypothetical protein